MLLRVHLVQMFRNREFRGAAATHLGGHGATALPPNIDPRMDQQRDIEDLKANSLTFF